ncbi:hypothetical protein CMK12_13340 [Candidatus Poribacteria bacterium]|nr:hypothetical protein [Candidatus Poribacteria bacterium]
MGRDRAITATREGQTQSWSSTNEQPKAMDTRFYILGNGCQWKALPHRLGALSTVDDRFQE